MKFNRALRFLVLAIFVGLPAVVSAQIRDDKGDRSPYYINLNQSPKTVFEIQEGLLSLQYYDKIGRANSLSLKIHNWRRELMTTYSLSKAYGLNYFNIQLDKDITLEYGAQYTCEMTDETGQHYGIFFKPVGEVETEPPVVGLLVNPVSVDCGDPTANVVEFYGDIKDGKAPYKVSWYVMNSTRTSFVYQPKDETIERPGYTTVITVERDPDYYVMLLVRDACGAEARQMIHLTCGKKKKKVNTVFVEPLDLALPGEKK